MTRAWAVSCRQTRLVWLVGPMLYGYANANPVSYIDRDGRIAWFPIVDGATVGAGLDVAFQLYQNNGRLECVDWSQTVVSAAAGAVGGGLFTAIKAGSRLASPVRSFASRNSLSSNTNAASGVKPTAKPLMPTTVKPSAGWGWQAAASAVTMFAT